MSAFNILKRGLFFKKTSSSEPVPEMTPTKMDEEIKKPKDVPFKTDDLEIKEKRLNKKLKTCKELLDSSSQLKKERRDNLEKIYSQLMDKKMTVVRI